MAFQPTEDNLLNLSDSGAPPQSRLTSAQGAHALFVNALLADRESARDRANIADMIDGGPPYEQDELEQLGQGGRVNLNFLEGTAVYENALTTYYDLTASVDKIATIELEYGDTQQRGEWEGVIAEEFDRTLRDDPRFESNIQGLAREFILFGVGLQYFEDDWDWRWKYAGLRDFLIPRHTPGCEDDLDYLFCRRRYTTTGLYKFIQDPEFAASCGWNVAEVQTAIRDATTSRNTNMNSMEWEIIEMEIKENDLYFGRVRAKEIQVLHVWVKEFDGSVSHFITLENGRNEDFLYKKISRFEKIQDCVNIFTYGIGNGFYHSIRGLGYKIFPEVQISNQLRCSTYDSTFFAASQVVQPADMSDLDDLSFAYIGPFCIVPPGLKFVEVKRENVADSILPVIQDLSQVIQKNTGTYANASGPEADYGGERKTKLEMQARLGKESTLGVAATNLFYQPWERMLNAVFKRMVANGLQQDHPGGYEAYKFRARCMKRGVPAEALKHVKHVHATRAIGMGSPQARVLALDEITQLATQMDEIGRRNALRDRIAARVGYANVDRYVPKLEEKVRPPVDLKFANLENALMLLGQSVPVNSNDNHITHLGAHSSAIANAMQSVKGGVTNPMVGLQQVQILLQHSQGHLRAMANDPTRIREVKLYNKTFNIVENWVTELQHNISEMQQQTAQMQSQQGGKAPIQGAQAAQQQQDPKIQALIQASQLKQQIMQQESNTKQRIQAAEGQQRMALDDARYARREARSSAEAGNLGGLDKAEEAELGPGIQ